MTLSLFADCVLPACNHPVIEAGEVCPDCRLAFGDLLRETEQPALTAEQIATRDADTRDAYAAMARGQEGEKRRNQQCWICEERRTCTRMSTGWECTTCAAIEG